VFALRWFELLWQGYFAIVCTQVRLCEAVVEGRIFPSLCTLSPGPGVGVCCEIPTSLSNQEEHKDKTTVPGGDKKQNNNQTTDDSQSHEAVSARQPHNENVQPPRRISDQKKPARKQCGQLQYSRRESLNEGLGVGPELQIQPRLVSAQDQRYRGIVGGREVAEEASQPWVASLGIVHQQDDLVDLLCGATLVSSLSLLTAAHCINNRRQACHFHLST